jgi:hypothetical protein
MTESAPGLDPDKQVAQTAGEQDHENIETFIGEPADPPEDIGRPADDGPES